jgi:hypothetical protein
MNVQEFCQNIQHGLMECPGNPAIFSEIFVENAFLW